jgi:hypothetical protein
LSVAPSPSLWLGPSPTEARAAYQRARVAGMSALRALVLGNVASFRECWAFRSKLAAKAGCSVRTVQRALTQATELGLMGRARAKPNERPPGLDQPLPCGWSHRWIVGWGKAGEAVQRAIDTARARVTLRRATRTVESCTPKPKACASVRSERAPRRWTAAELDAELAHAATTTPAREKPPP